MPPERPAIVSLGKEPPSVLAIDDDPVTLMLLHRIFRNESYIFETARSGEAAWAIIQSKPPDVAICDWSLPDLSGIVLCQRVKESAQLSQQTRMLLLTAHNRPHHKRLAMGIGVDAFLTKPIDPYELRLSVQASAQSSRFHRAYQYASHRLLADRALLDSLSLIDRATGVLNRRALDEALWYFLERVDAPASLPSDRQLGVLLIEVVDLEKIQLAYGYRIANEVLRAIAGRLQNNGIPESFLYRYNLAEFVCLTPNFELANTTALAKWMRGAIERHPIAVDGILINVAVRVGGLAIACPKDISVPEFLEMVELTVRDQCVRDVTDVTDRPNAHPS